MTTDNRTNERSHNRIKIRAFRDGEVSIIHEDQVLGLACTLDELKRAVATYEARGALEAAGVAPQEPSRLPDFFAPKPMSNSYVPAQVLPSSGVDEGTLANLIHSTSVAHFGGLYPRVAPIIARAVAAWLERQGGEGRESTDAN